MIMLGGVTAGILKPYQNGVVFFKITGWVFLPDKNVGRDH